jgi:hypothetical protein
MRNLPSCSTAPQPTELQRAAPTFFVLRENSESRSKVKYLRQRIYKKGCHKVPSCPPIVQYIYITDTVQISCAYLCLFVGHMAKTVIFSESFGEVSVLSIRGVNAGI